ncbi:Inner membrane protein YpjD [hydrothermal vent metagenome]|uniref:Inner membrane protein YpjD n=1 Tax=hydrothermal vent metagenome TaxID=652676 RepID=A0A3B0YDC1_9ZZZZ
MNAITSLIAFALYLTSTLALFMRLRGSPEGGNYFSRKPVATLLLPGFAAVILHGFVLYTQLTASNGFQLGILDALSCVFIVISLLVLLMSIKRRTEILAVFILPFSALALLIQNLSEPSYILPYDAPQGLKIHVLVSIIAYSILGLAACIAIMLSLQNRLLHHHHPGGWLKKIPPLQTMEKLLFDFIAAGFIGLTIALGSGFVFLDDLMAQHLAHKTVLSVIAWLVFAILLTGRFTLGWRGRTAIRWTLSGFASLMLAYFGSKIVLAFFVS